MSSTAPRQLRTSEPAGPLHAPAADVDTGLALSAGSALPAWSDSPRQLKQGERVAQLRGATEAAPAPSQAGLPDGLRQGIESLSGMDMSGVRVHRNSGKPAALQAHAYAQGQEIHLGPGQEKHLPHEAWHVVQQAQGRVRPTRQMKAGVGVNEDVSLETEANVMGQKAALEGRRAISSVRMAVAEGQATVRQRAGAAAPVQRVENTLATSTQPVPTMLEEIEAQYTAPDGQLRDLWAGGARGEIARYQTGGLPYHSRANIAEGPTGRRPGNPTRVTAHGSIGNLEAHLRGVRGEPYDGGHLIAYSAVGPMANVYENVAPQGKKLNNGPLSLWEDRVLGGAIRETAELLRSKGVRDIPHTFHYDVFVSYPASKYLVPKQAVIDAELAPPAHAEVMPENFSFIKRIPLHWSAHAQALALPSAEDMGASSRPPTPFLNAPTMDYGIVGASSSNQNFQARGPAGLVSKLNYGAEGELSEGTAAKYRRAPEGLANNPKLACFAPLTPFGKGSSKAKVREESKEPEANRDLEATVEWLINGRFEGTNFRGDDVTNMFNAFSLGKSKTTRGVKEFRVINALYTSPSGSIDGSGTAAVIRAALRGERIEKAMLELVAEVIEASLQLEGTIAKMVEEKSPVAIDPRDANTLDFRSAQQLGSMATALPAYATLRFEADDTQPN